MKTNKMKKINLVLVVLIVGIILCVFAVGQIPPQPPPQPPTPPNIEPPPGYYQQEPSTPYLYPNAQVNPWSQGQWKDAYCNQTGMDFLVEIMPDACSPAVVRSDLLEEQDVPVLCRMTGVKINPVIQVPYIKRIIPSVENKSDEVGYVTFLPARYALSYYAPEAQKRPGFEGTPTMSNLGYLWIHLKRQPVEEKMPETVDVDMSVRIIYDVARTYGINENQFVLPLLSQEEWFGTYKSYGFWRNKGYLRLQEITGKSSAKIALYTNPNMQPFAVKELRVGETLSKKDEIMLPGFYCGAGATLRLDEISVPKTRARLLVNGDEVLLGEGERIQESGCVVQDIESSPYSYSGTAAIRCPGQAKQTLILRDIEATLKIEKEKEYEEEDVSVGSEIIVEKDKKTNHFYVGFLGKEYTGEGLESVVIIFSAKDNGVLSKNAVEKTSDSIHSYVKSERGIAFERLSETSWNQNLRGELKKRYPSVEKQIDYFYVLKKGLVQGVDDIEMTVVDVTGPEQVNYPDNIEALYRDAVQHYRDVSHAYSTEQHPEGMYYGVIALHNAADLAAYLHKKVDQVEILQELIDKYSDFDEPEIVAEVENAREELRRTVNLGGENSATFSRPDGNYFIQLISVEKPSLAMQSADIEVNGTRGTYGIGDTIDVWQVSDITETGVVFDNLVRTEQKETVALGGLIYLNQTRVKLFDTVIKREAKVTVLPFEKERETVTNFSVKIGIEKRAIQLSPEKTRELIGSLDRKIEQFENIRDKLGSVVSAWKKACHVGAYALWIKNFVTGLGGEAAARKRVMEKWTTVCADPAYRQNIGAVSVSDCYRKKESAINQDIGLMKDSLNEANSFVKNVKGSEGVTKSGGLFGLAKTVDDEKFMDVADETFPDELENIGTIYQQKQLKKITLADGPILYGGREHNNINELITNVGGPQAFESIKDEYGELKNRFVDTQIIAGNITFLHQKNQLYKDDVKDLYLNLELYKECRAKGASDSALCQEVIRGTYGELNGYYDVIKEGTAQEALKDVLGIDAVVVVPEKRNVIKAPVYTMKNFPKLRASLGEDEQNRFAYFYHAGAYYVAIVEATGDNNFGIITLYSVEKLGEDDVKKKETWTSETEKTLIQKMNELGISHVEEVDFTLCNNNEIKTPYRNEIKFWESGPYKDYVALMPVNSRDGWYMATTYTGLEGALVAWKENADINVFWICNVGQDGVPNFDHSKGPVGDDCCTQVALVTGVQPEIPPLSEAGSKQVVEQAKTCARNAIAEYTQGKRKIDTRKCGVFTLGKPPAARPAMQCEDFMSPTDCRIMFNLCDPVMCPPSRCDLGGRMPVDNVIASGVVGSLMLCLPNFEDGRGVLVPVCLTGVHAGIDNFVTILEAGRECLQEQLESGKTVGICDEIMSVYKCEFFWRQFEPFVQAGIPAITESLTRRGGGEYALFGESWQQSLDAYRYFTDYYSETSKQAFKARSTAQIGTEICKRFTSVTYPTQAQFWEEIGKPESPTQAMAWFDERELGGGSPESHYKVFFHIFAGRDQGVYYSIYLAEPSAPGYYQPPSQYFVPAEQGGFGYIPAGEYVSYTPDFRAPSGYKKICIRLNEKEICGFGQATTNFAIEELQNYYLQEQAAKDVNTAKECVSGKPTIIPTATLNIQSAVEHALEPAIYRRGVIRVCSSLNPGQSTEPDRWKRIGDCDNPDVGCWLDTKSVEGAVSDLGIQENIMTEAEEKDIAHTIEEYGLDKPEESQDKLNAVEPKILDLKTKVEKFIAKVNEMDVATYTRSKESLENEIETIDNEIEPLIIELREISKLCVRSEEKARADYGLAQVLDLRAKLNAQLGVYEAEKTRASCPGVWLASQECVSKGGTIQEGTFIDQRKDRICCILPEEVKKESTFVEDLFDTWPLDLTHNELSSCYGWRTLRGSSDFTDGIDISAPRGTGVYAVAGGEVIRAVSGCVRGNENCNFGFGNAIVIKHSGNLYTGYHHLSSVNVKLGDDVKEGNKIGEVGSTGKSTGDHLDIKVYVSEADIWKSNTGKHPLCFFSSAIRARIRARKEAEDDSLRYSDNYIYSEKSGGCNPSQAYCREVVNIYTEECEILGRNRCNEIRGSCWWDSVDATCRKCPPICEGINYILSKPKIINYEVPVTVGSEDIFFKTKSDCEQNNCGLSCLWSADGKCYSITEGLIDEKIENLNVMTADELTKLKNLIENNKDRLSSSKVNIWLSQINSRLEEIGPSISDIVLIYSSINDGPLTPDNKLVEYDDSVLLCAVVKDNNGNLYSKASFGNVQKYTGDAEFRWYNIIPLYQPQYLGAEEGAMYELFAKAGKNDILQYEQRQIGGDDWCISLDKNIGTYWYRVEATIEGYTISSLGEAASPKDRTAYINKYGGTVDFNKYEGYWHTLLKPDSMEHYAISEDVSRISRKSNYAETICEDLGYNRNEKRCQFISTLEAFKNVPFAYGCSYYGCDPDVEFIGGECALEHLTEEFIAIDCLDLMIGALSETTNKEYAYNDFDNFIANYGSIKHNIEKRNLNYMLGLLFRKDNQIEVGDLIFMWRKTKGGYYTHTFIVYNDDGSSNNVFDNQDTVVYASAVCPGANPMDKTSIKFYDGQLCYSPIGRYLDDPEISFTLFRIDDLD